MKTKQTKENIEICFYAIDSLIKSLGSNTFQNRERESERERERERDREKERKSGSFVPVVFFLLSF